MGDKALFFKHRGIMEKLPVCHEYLDSLDGSALGTELYFETTQIK